MTPSFRLEAAATVLQRAVLTAALAACAAGCLSPSGPLNNSEEIRDVFADPPRTYSTAPLWVWNDMLTEEQVRGTLRDLARQHVRQAFVHPRPGLMTPYLSPEWFRLWETALDEAADLDMNIWIYDENSYPSGFAGGLVPNAMPESRGRGLRIETVDAPPTFKSDIIAVYHLTGSRYENLSEKARSGGQLPKGRYAVARLLRASDSPWNGGKCYVDLLFPGVTRKFHEITLDAYKREIGGEFGDRVPGVFTDEPHLRPAGGLPWTDDLPQVFKKKWGYDLLDHLPGLVQKVGDYKRTRHNYFQVLLDLFVERWGKPYHDYCKEAGLEFTGHYWEHEWPRCVSVPDNMAMYAWHQRPAIDCLMNRYDEGTHAQFGNLRAVRELSSVANQLGVRRTLCEAYGAGGWDLRFEDMKRIADWLYVLGVNTLDEHLSYITIRGARKRDHPQSFSYHEPWWDAYHVRADYVTRLSAVLSQGRQENPFLVLEPTTTAWFYQGGESDRRQLDDLGNRFQNLLRSLEKDQIEYDIGCEDILAREGRIVEKRLLVGQATYTAVVLPPLMENVNARTATLLKAFVQNGGSVLCCGDPPSLVEGRASEVCRQASRVAGWQHVAATDVPRLLRDMTHDGFAVHRKSGDKGILFHHRRRVEDGEFLFLVNTSIEQPSAGTVTSRTRGIERWDPYTGKTAPFPFLKDDGGVKFSFDLPPCGSLLLFLSAAPREPAPQPATDVATIPPDPPAGAAAAGPQTKIRRLEPNVLVLDYVDVSAGGESLENAYVYAAGQFAFRKNGMDRNPWDSAVQFRDEIISRTFPPGSGFTATYRFRIDERVPPALLAVVERPDLYRITLNGQSITSQEGSWWLDRSFGKLDIRAAAKVGENELVLVASPFTVYHEIEAVYILGDFGVKPRERGFSIVPAKHLTLGAWNDRLHPFYAGGVAYEQTYTLAARSGSYRVALSSWYGSVARVDVNGRTAGYIESAPWECDVTNLLQDGPNAIEVVVTGTLKNTLGPHHGNPGLGSAWPGTFQKAPKTGPPPGADYSTVGYGLMKPFNLQNERERPAMQTDTSPDADPVELARQFIRDHETRIEPLETALSLAWWKANTTGRDEDFAAKVTAQNQLDAALSDPGRFKRLERIQKALAASGAAPPLIARQIRLLHFQALEKHLDPELLRKIAAKENAVEKVFNVYRARVDGKELSDSEIREVLKESRDSARRKAVWEASKGVGPLVESDLKDLVKLRNEAAHRLGFPNYHAMQLQLSEQNQQQVLRLFDELEKLTRGPFHAVKEEIDTKLAADYGIAREDLRPWHYHDPFFQEAPAVYAVDLDAPYEGQDIPALCRKFYAGIGLPVDDVLARSDLYEREGKNPHAFCTDIDRKGDVRVLGNIVANEYWMGTMLHELGHSVYSSKNIPPSVPYVLRTEAHILTTEGIAMLFEKFSKRAEFLQDLGVKVNDPAAFNATARKMERNRLLIFAAWCQVMLRFEVAMYENPDQDLNKLWWDLVEKYQEIHPVEGRDAPDYAAKIHVVSAPAYYHNYLMGELFASQLHAAICREVLGADPSQALYNGRKDVGDFLKTKVFAPGRTVDWNTLTRQATGEDLNAKAFAARFRESREK